MTSCIILWVLSPHDALPIRSDGQGSSAAFVDERLDIRVLCQVGMARAVGQWPIASRVPWQLLCFDPA